MYFSYKLTSVTDVGNFEPFNLRILLLCELRWEGGPNDFDSFRVFLENVL